MPYIYFNFAPGSPVYIKDGKCDEICSTHAYILLTVKTFFRKKNVNYYRLSNGNVYCESSLISPAIYYYIATAAREQYEACLEKTLEGL